MQCLAISLSMMSSCSSLWLIRQDLLFKAGKYSIMWICSIFSLFVLSYSYFLGLTAVKCAAVNMGVQVSLRILDFNCLDRDSEVGLWGEWVQMLLPATYRFGAVDVRAEEITEWCWACGMDCFWSSEYEASSEFSFGKITFITVIWELNKHSAQRFSTWNDFLPGHLSGCHTWRGGTGICDGGQGCRYMSHSTGQSPPPHPENDLVHNVDGHTGLRNADPAEPLRKHSLVFHLVLCLELCCSVSGGDRTALMKSWVRWGLAGQSQPLPGSGTQWTAA